MDLFLNDILHLSQEEISNSKIESNMQAGSGGQPFLDRWLKHTEEEKANGTCKECCMVSRETFILDSGFLVSQKCQMMNGYLYWLHK